MAKKSFRQPTKLELEILKILWKEHPATVGEVRETLAGQGRDLAYTSVMTMLTIMTRKRYLSRVKQKGSYLYTPILTEKSASQNLLRDIVDRVFEGSMTAVLINLLETSDVDPEELKQLRALINQKIEEDKP
jgi:BlaI family transcriptional regulator, penicillinase repressor